MLGFLIATVMAIDLFEKNKKAKNIEDGKRIFKAYSDACDKITNEVRDKYVDDALEYDVELMSDKDLAKLVKKMPSYDKSEGWNFDNRDEYDALDFKYFRKRFAMVKYGKIPYRDSDQGWHEMLGSPKRGSWWGVTGYDYRGQIKHELMVEWERQLKEKGFPYDLMVYNRFDHSEKLPGIKVSLAIPAREGKYRFENDYFWSYKVDPGSFD